MNREEIKNQSMKEMKVRHSGHAHIPKHLFFSSEKIIDTIERLKLIFYKPY